MIYAHYIIKYNKKNEYIETNIIAYTNNPVNTNELHHILKLHYLEKKDNHIYEVNFKPINI